MAIKDWFNESSVRGDIAEAASKAKAAAGGLAGWGKGLAKAITGPANPSLFGQGLDPEIAKVPYDASNPATDRRATPRAAPTNVVNPEPAPSLRAAPVTATPNVPAVYNPVTAQAPGLVGGPTNVQQPAPKAPNMSMPNLVKPAYVPGENYDFGGRVGPNGEIKSQPAKAAPRGLGVKLPGALAVGAEALDPNVRAAVDPTSDMSMTGRLKQGARSALRAGGGLLGAAGGAALGGGIASLPLGMAGGYAGYQLGDKAADMLVGEAPQPSLRTSPVAPAMAGSIPSSQPEPQQAPAQQAPAAPPTQPPIIQPAQQPAQQGVRQDVTQPLRSLYEGKSGIARGIGGMAALGAYGALGRLNAADAQNKLRMQNQRLDAQKTNAELGLRSDTNDIAASKVLLDASQSDRVAAQKDRDYAASQRETNAKTLDTELEQQAIAGTANTPGLFTKDSEYRAAVSKTKADLANRINYSFADRNDGKRADQASPAEKQQLFRLEKVRKNMESGRSGFWQSASDFFGNKRFDSKNLYSYQPVSAKRTASGKYDIKMANGNSVSVEALRGGGFNLLGPNEPVDSDLQEMIMPLIRKAEGK